MVSAVSVRLIREGGGPARIRQSPVIAVDPATSRRPAERSIRHPLIGRALLVHRVLKRPRSSGIRVLGARTQGTPRMKSRTTSATSPSTRSSFGGALRWHEAIGLDVSRGWIRCGGRGHRTRLLVKIRVPMRTVPQRLRREPRRWTPTRASRWPTTSMAPGAASSVTILSIATAGTMSPRRAIGTSGRRHGRGSRSGSAAYVTT